MLRGIIREICEIRGLTTLKAELLERPLFTTESESTLSSPDALARRFH
jgi:hypothetical protein